MRQLINNSGSDVVTCPHEGLYVLQVTLYRWDWFSSLPHSAPRSDTVFVAPSLASLCTGRHHSSASINQGEVDQYVARVREHR